MKKLIVVLPLSILFMISCQDKQAMTELDELKTRLKLEEQNIALVEKYIGAWNTKDFQVIDDLIDPQYKLYLPSTNPNPMSAEQFIGWYETIFQAFPDVHYDIKEIFADGNSVAVRWVFTGTHEGEFQGIPATGKRIEVSAIEIYQVQNGKIFEERGETDGVGWKQQLGL